MTYEYHEYDDIEYAQAHCDRRVCHKPGKCEYCDRYSSVQQSRLDNKVGFTGEAVPEGWRPCPCDAQRGDSHERWGGNQPVGGDLTLQEKERLRMKQSAGSLAFYGDVQGCKICGGAVNPWKVIHEDGLESQITSECESCGHRGSTVYTYHKNDVFIEEDQGSFLKRVWRRLRGDRG